MTIGIFWYHENQIIGIAHEFNLSDQDSLGLIDSPYTHVEYLEILKIQIVQLQTLEYEEIPRGRVIHNSLSNKTIVYMDTKLFKKHIAKQIAVFFQLNFDEVVWKKDPYYKS